MNFLSFTQQALVLFILGTIPILFGAVQAWIWPIYTVAAYAAVAALAWSAVASDHSARGRSGATAGWAAAALFLALTLAACLPLPDALLALLSPARFDLLRHSADLTGSAPVWSTISYAPLQSLAWWAFLLGLALLFAVLSARLANARFLRVTLWVLLALAVAQALYGLLQALIPNLGVLWVTYLQSGMGDARGTYINRNHFAGFMAMLLPLLLGFSLSRVRWEEGLDFRALLRSDRPHQHMLMVLGLVLMALALLFSKSRGGITGTLVGLFVFVVLVRGGARRIPAGVWAVMGLFLGLTLFYGLRIGFGPIIERFLAIDADISRLGYWRDSLPVIAAHPFGIGLAAFETVFPIYEASLGSETRTAVHLHNDVLQLLVEAGWAGFVVLAGAFTLFMLQMLRRIRRMGTGADPGRFFLAAGAYSGLVALSLHSFLDFNLQIPANAVYFVTLMAIVRVTSRGAIGDRR